MPKSIIARGILRQVRDASFLCLPAVVQFQQHRLSVDEEWPACPCVRELWVAAGDFALAVRTDCTPSVRAGLGHRSQVRDTAAEQTVVLGSRSHACFINCSRLERKQHMNESTAARVRAKQRETRSRVPTNVSQSTVRLSLSLSFPVLVTFFPCVFFSTVSLQANRESRTGQGYLRGSQTDRMARFFFSSLRTNRRSINKRQ